MKTIIIFLISITILNSVRSQGFDSITLSKLKVNFAIPDMPAFKALGTEPSNLLRPSTVQALAVTVSELYQDRKFLLPEAFALEVSPSLLINAKKGPVELTEYARKAVLNSIRISLGTSSDTLLSPSGRSLSLGLRISLINKGDLTTDTTYQKKISDLLEKFRENVRKVSLVKFAAMKGISMTGSDIDADLKILGDSTLKKEFDAFIANDEEESQKLFSEGIRQLKEEYKRENWNANKLDFAAAILNSSPDSLLKNIRFNRAELWLTGAIKAGKSGQLLIGINAQTAKNLLDTVKTTKNNTYFNMSIPARYLIGTNRVKGFAETQYSYRGHLKEHFFLFNLGAEINIIDGLWIHVNGGLDYNSTASSTKFTTNFNLKFNLPENFSFF